MAVLDFVPLRFDVKITVVERSNQRDVVEYCSDEYLILWYPVMNGATARRRC